MADIITPRGPADFAPRRATLTVISEYIAPPFGPSGYIGQMGGRIALFDLYPWVTPPGHYTWDTTDPNYRGLVGASSWSEYHDIPAAFDSASLGPAYDPSVQGPKDWPKLYAQKDIIYVGLDTLSHLDVCAQNGSATGTGYIPLSIHSKYAFDPTTDKTLLSTLVVTQYAFTSYPPGYAGTTGNLQGIIKIYYVHLTIYSPADVPFEAYPTTWRWWPTDIGVPQDTVANPHYLLQSGATPPDPSLAASLTLSGDVTENNGSHIGFSTLWHPGILQITGFQYVDIVTPPIFPPPPPPPPPPQPPGKPPVSPSGCSAITDATALDIGKQY